MGSYALCDGGRGDMADAGARKVDRRDDPPVRHVDVMKIAGHADSIIQNVPVLGAA